MPWCISCMAITRINENRHEYTIGLAMYRLLLIIAIMLAAVAMALSLAHALELPGKMRLDKDTYLAVQKIYYPGFTIGGIAEPLGIIALLVLLVLTPSASTRFWWILAALLAMVVTHAIFWFVTQPVNSFWTKDAQLTGLAAMFFSLFPADVAGDWSKLRDIWEYSHLARSVFAMLSFLLLLITVTG